MSSSLRAPIEAVLAGGCSGPPARSFPSALDHAALDHRSLASVVGGFKITTGGAIGAMAGLGAAIATAPTTAGPGAWFGGGAGAAVGAQQGYQRCGVPCAVGGAIVRGLEGAAVGAVAPSAAMVVGGAYAGDRIQRALGK